MTHSYKYRNIAGAEAQTNDGVGVVSLPYIVYIYLSILYVVHVGVHMYSMCVYIYICIRI